MNYELLSYIFKRMPEIDTERLVLRPIKMKDVDDMFEYSCNKELTEYLLWYPHENKGYTKEYLKLVCKRIRSGAFYDWAVVKKQSGKMIGTCGFTSIDTDNRKGEIGYVINPDFKGRGYATEAARAVIDFGFDVLSLNRIEAKFMQGNDSSLRVMQKLGMTFEGYMREAMYVKGRYRTIGQCAILASEYESRKLN